MPFQVCFSKHSFFLGLETRNANGNCTFDDARGEGYRFDIIQIQNMFFNRAVQIGKPWTESL